MWKYYIFFLYLCFVGGGSCALSSPPPLRLPPAYSHSAGINDKEEWIQRGGWDMGVRRGALDGKWTTPIKRIRLINGCRIAEYRCEQVHFRPTRFRLS